MQAHSKAFDRFQLTIFLRFCCRFLAPLVVVAGSRYVYTLPSDMTMIEFAH
jgi:hypothetical protein